MPVARPRPLALHRGGIDLSGSRADEASTIGAFEAKTHLSKLLDRAARGTRFVITKRGRPVAQLVPYVEGRTACDRMSVLAEFRSIRQAAGDPVDILELRDDGRKQ